MGVHKDLSKSSWAAKSLRSGFGKQCLASQKSSPACGFGSSTRDASNRTYVSPEVDKAQCRAQGGNNSQGPTYQVQEALGKQVSSTLSSAPMPGFGSSVRPSMALKSGVPGPGAYKTRSTVGEQVESVKFSSPKIQFGLAQRDAADKLFMSVEHEKAQYGKESPGPGTYSLRTGMGKQLLSERPSLPAWAMGTDQRFRYDFEKSGNSMPGPGQYTAPRAVGKQIISTKKSVPTVGFGRAERDAGEKVFISAEHEKSSYGKCSPGPGTAAPGKSIGPQVLSHVSRSPAPAFGTSSRLCKYDTDSPGPGEYFA